MIGCCEGFMSSLLVLEWTNACKRRTTQQQDLLGRNKIFIGKSGDVHYQTEPHLSFQKKV